jgi:hypothetical protein
VAASAADSRNSGAKYPTMTIRYAFLLATCGAVALAACCNRQGC